MKNFCQNPPEKLFRDLLKQSTVLPVGTVLGHPVLISCTLPADEIRLVDRGKVVGIYTVCDCTGNIGDEDDQIPESD